MRRLLAVLIAVLMTLTAFSALADTLRVGMECGYAP